MSIVAWATGVFATHSRSVYLQAITLRQEVRQQGNASAAPQQVGWQRSPEPGKLVFIRRRGLPPASAGLGQSLPLWRHRLAASNSRVAMMRQHIAQHTVDFMAGVAGGQQRLATGDLLAHAGEMAKIAIAEGMVQQFAALLGAGRGRTDDMQYRNMFRIATRNAVQRAQFADAVKVVSSAPAPLMRA